MATKDITLNAALEEKSVGFPPAVPTLTYRPSQPAKPGGVFVLERVIDFAKDPLLQTVANGGLGQVATADVLKILNLANIFVLNVAVDVIAATGLTSTCTVGDGSNASSWKGSVNLNSVGPNIGVGDADAYVTQCGKLYTSADVINMTFTISNGPITTGKIKVKVYCLDPM